MAQEDGTADSDSGSSSSSSSSSSSGSSFASIGTCVMQDDGALVLSLRATGGPGGAMGTAVVTYKCGDENYAEILAHMQPIRPGETKSVAPWPD